MPPTMMIGIISAPKARRAAGRMAWRPSPSRLPWPFTRHQIWTITTSAAAIISPGTMPARNSRVIEVSVETA